VRLSAKRAEAALLILIAGGHVTLRPQITCIDQRIAANVAKLPELLRQT
jgi:hypothetical protein